MIKIISKHRFAKISPQKARLLANVIRNKSISQSLKILQFSNKKSSTLIFKVLKSAISNAMHNHNIKFIDLFILYIFIDCGPIIKRIMPRAKGRFDQISKRTSHITIVLSKKNKYFIQGKKNYGSKS